MKFPFKNFSFDETILKDKTISIQFTSSDKEGLLISGMDYNEAANIRINRELNKEIINHLEENSENIFIIGFNRNYEDLKKFLKELKCESIIVGYEMYRLLEEIFPVVSVINEGEYQFILYGKPVMLCSEISTEYNKSHRLFIINKETVSINTETVITDNIVYKNIYKFGLSTNKLQKIIFFDNEKSKEFVAWNREQRINKILN
jgi:hypothetical protein